MSWMGVAATAFSTILPIVALQGTPRLTSQRLEGIHRVCIYGVEPRHKARRIGSGEPCPQTYREPEQAVEFVPASAMRIGESRGIGHTICLYRFGSRDYRTLLPALVRCPLSPAAGMRVERDPNASEQ